MSLQVEEVRISLPHIELAAHLFGPPDGQPVIALHGWLDNAMSFRAWRRSSPGCVSSPSTSPATGILRIVPRVPATCSGTTRWTC